MPNRSIIPRIIIVLFAIDTLLCFSYVMNFLIGEPSVQLTRLINLDGEMNIPAWYSSLQWFCVAFLLGIFAVRNFDWSNGKSWVLILFPLMFLAFSADEIACVHEWVGTKCDVLLPTGNRKDSFFRATGIWFFVLGVPVLSSCLLAFSSLRRYFKMPPQVFRKMILGIFIFFGGAIGVEVLSNIPDQRSFGFVLEVFFEEWMEMAGVTVLFWAAHDMLLAHGFTWNLDPVTELRTSPRLHPCFEKTIGKPLEEQHAK